MTIGAEFRRCDMVLSPTEEKDEPDAGRFQAMQPLKGWGGKGTDAARIVDSRLVANSRKLTYKVG